VERPASSAALYLVRYLEIFRASSFSHHLISLPSFFNVHQVLPCYRHRTPDLDTSKTGLRHSTITIDLEFSPLRVTTTTKSIDHLHHKDENKGEKEMVLAIH
jgi:hypothetical protein